MMKLFLSLPLVAVLAIAPAALAKADAAKGEKLYQANCAMCHGATGKGDGPAAASLKPAPRDLVNGKYTHGSSLEEVTATIENGIEKSPMPPFKASLKPEELASVAAYVVSIHKGEKAEDKKPASAKPEKK
jgi:high-affinity iron transporter